MSAISVLVLAVHGVIGWGLCGAIMGVGRKVTTLERTQIIHAVGAPVIFGMVALIYFTQFSYTAALPTALAFTSIVIALDAFFIAPVVEKSYEMFRSPIGTWIPFSLIFLSTFLLGLALGK